MFRMETRTFLDPRCSVCMEAFEKTMAVVCCGDAGLLERHRVPDYGCVDDTEAVDACDTDALVDGLRRLEEGTPVRLTCGHVFHNHCLLGCYDSLRKLNCPLCTKRAAAEPWDESEAHLAFLARYHGPHVVAPQVPVPPELQDMVMQTMEADTRSGSDSDSDSDMRSEISNPDEWDHDQIFIEMVGGDTDAAARIKARAVKRMEDIIADIAAGNLEGESELNEYMEILGSQGSSQEEQHEQDAALCAAYLMWKYTHGPRNSGIRVNVSDIDYELELGAAEDWERYLSEHPERQTGGNSAFVLGNVALVLVTALSAIIGSVVRQ